MRPLICCQTFPLWETCLLQEAGPFVTLLRLRSKMGIMKLLCLEGFGSLNSEEKWMWQEEWHSLNVCVCVCVSTKQSWTWSLKGFIKYGYNLQDFHCEASWQVAWMVLQSRSREYQTSKQRYQAVDQCTYIGKIFETWLGIVQLLLGCLTCKVSKSLGGAIVSMMQTPGFSCIR